MPERDDLKYLEEHHAITETAIGVASLHLKKGNWQEAAGVLIIAQRKLDAITLKYQPATAKLMDLCS